MGLKGTKMTVLMRVIQTTLTIVLASAALSLNNFAQAQTAVQNTNTAEVYDHTRIAKVAEDFILNQVEPPEGGEVKVEAGGIDARMVARHCEQPASVSLANNANLDRFSTVEISCATGAPWRTYVPVRIYLYAPVVAATRALSPGDMLTERDMAIRMLDTHMIRSGTYGDISQLVGARVKRRVAANDPIVERNTCLVCEGETVTIVASQQGMRVSARGVALNDGLLGESVAVRNQRSNREVRAIVAALNEVNVNL